MLGNEAKTITPFESKVWLSSPTMHGDELRYLTQAYVHQNGTIAAQIVV